MLSRTAEGLFWLGRYIERAENAARLLEAARRLDQMPLDAPEDGTEWSAILIAAGCKDSFNGDVTAASGPDVVRHIILDPENPSSIRNCLEAARSNARAQRIAITQQVWSTVNDGWRMMRSVTEKDCTGGALPGVLEQVRSTAAGFRGAVAGTQLRNEGFNFLRVGEALERADATARLLDVKYHVLLPEEHQTGGGYDQLQWNHLLRAAGARSAYRWAYRAAVSSELVVDFLVLNPQSPRSIRYAYDRLCERLERLSEPQTRRHAALEEAQATRRVLMQGKAQDILQRGLHEYLTDQINRTHNLSLMIGADFGFGPLAAQARMQSQA